MNLNKMNEDLLGKIRTAVRETKLEKDPAVRIYPLDDMDIDFLEKDEEGFDVYDVYGDTTAVLVRMVDRGDYYNPPEGEEIETDASVNLKVMIHPDYEPEVEVDTIMFNEEPWERDFD